MFAPYDLVGDTKGMYVAGYAGLAANGPKGARYSSLMDNARLVTANGGRLL